jgi:hypothetical protein
MVGVTTSTFQIKDFLGSVNSDLQLSNKRKTSSKKNKNPKNKRSSLDTNTIEKITITDLTSKLDDSSKLSTQDAELYLHYNEGSIIDKSLLDFSKLLFLDNMEGYPPDYRNMKDNVMDRFVVYADTQTHARIFM